MTNKVLRATLCAGLTLALCNLAAAQYGGGIENVAGALTVSSCTIASNTATVSGGGIYTLGSGTTYVSGSYVLGNGPDDTHTEAGSRLKVFNSIIGIET